MSQITKNAITEATFKLAAKKPLHKITVKNITNECGITRNTFYYYFKDIYDVVDSAFCEEIAKVASKDSGVIESDEAFFSLTEFVLKHKDVFMSMYAAMGDRKMKYYLKDRVHDMIMVYVKGEAQGINADKEDLSIIALFYEEALIGLVVRWLSGEMPKGMSDMAQMANKIRRIFTGHVRNAVENSVKNKEN